MPNFRKEKAKKTKRADTLAKKKAELESSLLKWKKESKNYINFSIIDKNKAKIIIVYGTRGTGKTTGSVFQSFLEFNKTKTPSVIVRRSFDEMKDFARSLKNEYMSGKYPKLLGSDLSLHFRGDGVWKNSSKGASYKSLRLAPVIQFVNINQMKKRTSVAFPEKIHYLIADEITNYSQGDFTFQSIIDYFQVFETILRGNDPKKLLIFLNNNFSDETFFDVLGIQKEFKKQKWGTINRYNLQGALFNKKISTEIAVYKYAANNKLEAKYEKSEITKFAQITTGYGDFLSGQKGLQRKKFYERIKSLGNYKFTLLINGHYVGVWLLHNKLQFSSRYNKTGKVYYLNFNSWEAHANRGSELFYNDIIKALTTNKIQFENLFIRDLIVGEIKIKYENEIYNL